MSDQEKSGQTDTASSKRTFTSAERIAELNEIDKSVAAMLKSAGSAVQVLANIPAPSARPTTLDTQKANFTKHSSDFFSTLSHIEVQLRRQIYALEEAGLIAPGDTRDYKRGERLGGLVNNVSGDGPLDASWLNAQASENVEKSMEKELWAQARELVEKYQPGGNLAVGVGREVGQDSKYQDMEVDKPEG